MKVYAVFKIGNGIPSVMTSEGWFTKVEGAWYPRSSEHMEMLRNAEILREAEFEPIKNDFLAWSLLS